MNWYKKAINAPSLEALEQKYHNWLSERLIEESYNFTERFPLSPYELKFVQTYLMEVKPSISKLRTLKDISKLRTLKDVFINTMNYYTKMAETTNDPEVLDRIVEMGLKAQITYRFVFAAAENSNIRKETLEKIKKHPAYKDYTLTDYKNYKDW